MSRISKLNSATVVLAVTVGCANIPTGPNVMALPGEGMPFDRFRNDDTLCERYAYTQVGGGTGYVSGTEYEMQQRYDVAYVQCMYAKGHRVPVSGQFSNAIPQSNSVTPATNIPPPPPGAPPPPPGTAMPVFPK
jgi:hypothetical protein